MVQVRANLVPLLRGKCGHGLSTLQVGPNVAMEIDACFLPLTLDRSLANIPHSSNFGEGKSAEELEVNDFCKGRLGLGKFVQRLADPREFPIVRRVLDFSPERSNLKLSSALLSTAASRVVND